MFIGVSSLRSFRTANIITVMWDPADSPHDCGPVLYYTVTLVNLDDTSDVNTIKANQSRAEFLNLKTGVSYNISVTAVNRAGAGPTSVITATAPSDNEGKL